MPKNPNHIDPDQFLEELQHPLKDLILLLRKIIKNAEPGLEENIKWNGPNYMLDGKDRLTMRLFPPKQVQLIFHRGAAVQEQPAERLIKDDTGLLSWKTNDRAVASFDSVKQLTDHTEKLTKLIQQWLKKTS